MPMFIPAALAIGATIATGTLATVLSIASVVSGMLLGAYQQRKAKKEAIAQYNASQVDRMANVVATTGPRELVLGRVRKGGNVAFRASTGTHNEIFLVHLAIAAHPIDAVEQVYLNDEPVSLTAEGYVNEAPYRRRRKVTVTETFAIPAATTDFFGVVTPSVTTVTLANAPIAASVRAVGVVGEGMDASEFPLVITVDGSDVTITNDRTYAMSAKVTYQYNVYDYFARIWWELGAANAVADARTMELFPDEWTAAHRGRGVAKIIAEFTYDETAFPSGIPSITARVRGAKVYDPRTGNTAWSRNPALLARHVYTHPWFGKSTLSAAEDARIIAAANACDVNHDYVVGPGSDVRDLYTADLVAPYGTEAATLLDDLSQAMAGLWCHAAGQLYIRAGVWTAPVFALTDDDLAVVQREGESASQEPINVQPHRERADRFNVVNVRIWDEDQDYKQVALTPIKGAALIAEDGGELPIELTLAAVSHPGQAQHVAGVMMRDARDPLVVDAPFKMTAYPLEIYDVVTLTLARYGWTGKTFLILNRVWHQDRGFVRLTLKETAPAIFTPDAAFLAQGRSPNTRLPKPWEIDPPTLLEANVTSGSADLVQNSDGSIVSRIRVRWPVITDKRILQDGRIDVRWRRVGDPDWSTITVDGDSRHAFIVGVRDGWNYVISARTRTAVAKSDWSDAVVHRVIGKTALPAQVSAPFTATPSGRRIKLNWPDNPEVDIAYYEVRELDADWGTPGYVYRGRASQVFVDPVIAAGDSKTWFVKAVDTGKRYSALARQVTHDRVSPPAPGPITARVADTSTTIAKITFQWPDTDPDTVPFGLLDYRAQLALPDGTTRTVWLRASEWTTDYDWDGDATLSVRTRDVHKNLSAATTYVRSKVKPNNVGTLTKTVKRGNIQLDWADVLKTSLPVAGYEVRRTNSGWGSAGYLYRGASSVTPFMPLLSGANPLYVRAFDTDGRYSAASATITHQYDLPPNITGTSLSRSGVYIVATANATPPKDLKHFEFRFFKTTSAIDVWNEPNAIVVRSQTNVARFRPPTLGTWRCAARMVDIEDNVSAASSQSSIVLPKVAL